MHGLTGQIRHRIGSLGHKPVTQSLNLGQLHVKQLNGQHRLWPPFQPEAIGRLFRIMTGGLQCGRIQQFYRRRLEGVQQLRQTGKGHIQFSEMGADQIPLFRQRHRLQLRFQKNAQCALAAT